MYNKNIKFYLIILRLNSKIKYFELVLRKVHIVRHSLLEISRSKVKVVETALKIY